MDILVTGGANGIGRATVHRLLAEGYNVTVLDKDTERLEELPEQVETIDADVTEDVSEVLEPEYDILVNCAGFQKQGSVEDMPLEVFEKHVQTNYIGGIRTIKAVLPGIKERKGRIVNVSSIAGRSTIPYLGAYSGSKYAVEGFTDALRMEMKQFDVDVVLVEPGPIKTGFNRKAAEALERYIPESDYTEDYRKKLETRGKNGRSPEKAAKVICEAIDTRRPRDRYTVTWQAWILPKLKTVLPVRLTDSILSRF